MEWVVKAIVLGFALAMDCLALGITDGLVYGSIKKRKYFFIAAVFGVFQGLMPLLGYLFGRIFAEWIDQYDHWIGFALLTIIAAKMIFDGVKGLVEKEEAKPAAFTYRAIIFQGIADSIDALAVGISLEASLGLASGSMYGYEVYVSVLIIAVMSFGIALAGLFGGRFFYKLFKGHVGVCNLIGGIIVLILGVLLLLEGLNVIAF